MKPGPGETARGSQQGLSVVRLKRSADRRAPDRPKNGDAAGCPRCRGGTIEFNERYRWLDGPTPAWICDRAACGYCHLVREKGPPATLSKVLIRNSKMVAASARRSAMRSRARAERSDRHIRDTEARIKRRRPD